MLGEAASQIPPEARDTHVAVAWKGATRMRNRIVHGYWDIDVDTLVATATDDLPQMVLALQQMIDSFDAVSSDD